LLKKNGIALIGCMCDNAFEDKEYGKGKRLHQVIGTTALCLTCTRRRTDVDLERLDAEKRWVN
jgi:hypothetical protein